MSGEHHYFRRRISRQQLEVLVQYMERYPALALASARSREGHIQSKRKWEKIARTLNRIDENQVKSGINWARYWNDLKFKIRRKYTIKQKCVNQGTHCTVQLSPLEERMVKILTDEKGILFPTGSMYQQMLGEHYSLKENSTTNLKPIADPDTNLNDSCDHNDTTDDTQDDFLITNVTESEHILLPATTDIKPNVAILKKSIDIDPIQILPDEKKSIDELKRDLVEFELVRQKELFEIEKQHKIEKHEMEMSILRLKKQIMAKELNKL